MTKTKQELIEEIIDADTNATDLEDIVKEWQKYYRSDLLKRDMEYIQVAHKHIFPDEEESEE